MVRPTIKCLSYITLLLLFTGIILSNTLDDTSDNKMPYTKKILWGDDGIIRKLNLAPENKENELRLRYHMLQTHQRLGLITLGMTAYQTYLGKQVLDGANRTKHHKYLGYATFSVYMTAAGFSIFSPPALRYEKGISSMKLHRYLSYIHFTGMLIMPYLGYLSAGNLDNSDYEYSTKALRAHEIVGSITFASLSLSFLTTLFP